MVVSRAALPPVLLRLASARLPASSCALSPGGVLVVGGAASCDLHLPEDTLSARHCRVSHAGDSVVVEDLGSRNGVEVGGALVPRAVVLPGAVVTLGRAVLEVLGVERGLRPLGPAAPLAALVGTSAPMLRLAESVGRIAPLALPVLIRGETGTGKDLVARAVHELSGRRGPYVALNAAAISAELAESELFGHRRGAFTGATAERRGAFREADGGTLFLDEVAALPLAVQAKLLRVVEDGAVRSLGAEGSKTVDVRLVAATCERLEELTRGGAFRADLLERLAVCVVTVPPLRERRGDIPALARAMLDKLGFSGVALTRRAERALGARPYPGNVRELRNLVAAAAVHAGAGAAIEAEDVAAAADARTPREVRPTFGETLACFEAAGRNVSAAARVLGLPRTTVRDIVRRRTTSGA